MNPGFRFSHKVWHNERIGRIDHVVIFESILIKRCPITIFPLSVNLKCLTKNWRRIYFQKARDFDEGQVKIVDITTKQMLLERSNFELNSKIMYNALDSLKSLIVLLNRLIMFSNQSIERNDNEIKSKLF